MEPNSRPRGNGNVDPRKRGPSGSPEGRRANKQTKPDQARDKSVEPGNHSRRSSTSNEGSTRSGKDRQRHPFGGPRDARPNHEFGKDMNGAVVNSPSSRTSANGGGTSGRSTPLQKGIPITNGATADSTNAAVSKQSFMDSLLNGMATQAELYVELRQAEMREKRAKEEYQATKAQFKEYDAIKERKTFDRDAAVKEREAKAKALLDHNESQKSLAFDLTSHIRKAVTSHIIDMDFVSRADYERLSADYLALKDEQKATNEISEQLRTELDEVKSIIGQVSIFQSELASLKNDAKAFQAFNKEESEKVSRGFKKLEDSVTEASRSVERTGKDFNTFKSVDVKRLATKEQFVDLETKYEKFEQAVTGVNKSNAQVLKDIAQLKADHLKDVAQLKADHVTLSNTKASTHSPDTDDEFKVRFERLYPEATTLPAALEKLGQVAKELDVFTRGEENEDFDAPPTTSSSVRKRLHHMEQQVDELIADIKEEGKEPPVRRFKNLDKIVNNLSTTVTSLKDFSEKETGPMLLRVSQLEQDLKELEAGHKGQGNVDATVLQRLNKLETTSGANKNDVDGTHQRPQGEPAPGDYATVEMLRALAVNVDNTRDQDEENLRVRDEHIYRDMADQGKKLREDFEEKEKSIREHIVQERTAQQDGTRQLQDSLNELKSSLAELNSKIASHVSVERFEAELHHVNGNIISRVPVEKFETELRRITQEYNKLHDQIRTQTAAPTHPPMQARQPPYLNGPSLHSHNGGNSTPPMPNGVLAHPQPNQPPSHGPPLHASPAGNTSVQAPTHVQVDAKNVQDQIDRVSMVLHQLHKRVDNFQSDTIVQHMSRHIAQIYPNAATFETAVQTLNTQFETLKAEGETKAQNQNTAIVNARVVATRAEEQSVTAISSAHKAVTMATTAAQDAEKAKSDSSKLSEMSKKLDEHESALSENKTRIQHYEEDFLSVSGQVKQHDEWLETLRDKGKK